VFAGWRDGSLHRAITPDCVAASRRLERATLRFLGQRLRAIRRGD
jgi:DNA topoisomerase-1